MLGQARALASSVSIDMIAAAAELKRQSRDGVSGPFRWARRVSPDSERGRCFESRDHRIGAWRDRAVISVPELPPDGCDSRVLG